MTDEKPRRVRGPKPKQGPYELLALIAPQAKALSEEDWATFQRLLSVVRAP